jgi:hypothetical protein
MSAILGLRGTGQFTTDFRPTNYRETFTLLEPNGSAPLNALLSMTQSESTDDPKYNHFRDELPNRVLTVNATHAAGDLPLTMTNIPDVQFAVPDTLLLNTTTNEIVRVTASPTATVITVQRGVAGSTAAAMAAGQRLVIVGFAGQEGAGRPTALSFDPTMDFNYTQIFKTGVSITGTLDATKLRTGSKEQEQITKALKLHMGDIERSFFWGRRFEENGSSAQPRRFTGGLFSTITNVIDAASGFASANTITEAEFDRTLIENIFAWGGKEKVAFCGPRVISNLQRIAKNRWQPTAVEGSYGVSMTRYSTFAGDLLVHLHPMFRQVPGFDHTMVLLDMPHLKYRYMEGRDTQLKMNVQAPDVDGKEHYYISECGLELTQGRVHSVIRNWQAT